MRIDKVNITPIKDSDTLLAFYHMNIAPIRKGYKNFLNKKFNGCEKLPFHKFVQRINIEEIKQGDIIIKSTMALVSISIIEKAIVKANEVLKDTELINRCKIRNDNASVLRIKSE